jgi:hypothetical protein
MNEGQSSEVDSDEALPLDYYIGKRNRALLFYKQKSGKSKPSNKPIAKRVSRWNLYGDDLNDDNLSDEKLYKELEEKRGHAGQLRTSNYGKLTIKPGKRGHAGQLRKGKLGK